MGLVEGGAGHTPAQLLRGAERSPTCFSGEVPGVGSSMVQGPLGCDGAALPWVPMLPAPCMFAMLMPCATAVQVSLLSLGSGSACSGPAGLDLRCAQLSLSTPSLQGCAGEGAGCSGCPPSTSR